MPRAVNGCFEPDLTNSANVEGWFWLFGFRVKSWFMGGTQPFVGAKRRQKVIYTGLSE